MKPRPLRRIALFACAAITCSLSAGAPPSLTISQGAGLSWSTTPGNNYQPQISMGGGAWTDLGAEMPGDGQIQSVFSEATGDSPAYQVLEIIPGAPGGPVTTNAVVNGGFESGSGADANNWAETSGDPPARTSSDAHAGAFSMRGLITGLGREGKLTQTLVPQGSSVTAGRTYGFSFWARQIDAGPSFVQQYEMEWLNGAGGVVGSTGLQNFNASTSQWQKIAPPNLVAPAGAADARVTFRFATGTVPNAGGEVLIDDVALESTSNSGPPGPPVIQSHAFTMQEVANLSWPTVAGMEYQPRTATELAPANWSDLTESVIGDGNPASILVPMTLDRQFFRVEYPVVPVLSPTNVSTVYAGIPNAIGLAWDASTSPGVTGYRIFFGPAANDLSESLEVGNVETAVLTGLTPGQTYFLAVVAITAEGESPVGSVTLSAQPETEVGIVALYNSSTVLEAPTTVDTPTALITYVADRARDRHAREAQFDSYDHYLSWYWEQRVANVEIVDRVAKGGTDITFNYTTLDRLNPAEFRTFFRGIGTVAEYNSNQIAALVSTNPSATPGETDYNYSATINQNPNEGNRALQIGDRVEIEISQFLLAPRNGRNNYYGTTMLYIVGQGIVPWAQGNDLGFPGGIVGNVNRTLDSHPLPASAWLGGQTTLPYQYSNEPEHRFKQTAGNISPVNGQPFMLGRRLHHTDFGNGSHSEAGNPVFSTHIGKLGPKFIANSCVACHTNNGRALPPAVGAAMFQSVVKVGSDAAGSPHPSLGSVLQPQITSGSVEGSATISSYTNSSGQYGDSTSYALRKPNYTFSGTTPGFFSVRIAPQLVGLGLLEAVSETTIEALADPTDSDSDGISGRMQTVIDPETGDQRLGRFTYKGGKARLDHQIAAALNTDMGVTTSIFPNLDGETTGGPAEVSDTDLDQMTRYVALLGVGARRDLSNAQALQGEQLFTSASCVKCHTPTLTTSPYHPNAELRSQTIHPYTDMLLHDMGPGLADNLGEDSATGSEWRTPPLWGIGLTAGVSGGEAYLHDGRARNLEEAILWHGGEAEASKEAFRTMPAADRAALIKFLKSL